MDQACQFKAIFNRCSFLSLSTLLSTSLCIKREKEKNVDVHLSLFLSLSLYMVELFRFYIEISCLIFLFLRLQNLLIDKDTALNLSLSEF